METPCGNLWETRRVFPRQTLQSIKKKHLDNWETGLVYLWERTNGSMGFLDKIKGKAEDAAKEGIEKGKEGIEDAVEKGTDLGKEGLDKAKDAAEKGYDKAKDTAKEGLDKAKDAAEKGYDKAKDTAKEGIDKAKSE